MALNHSSLCWAGALLWVPSCVLGQYIPTPHAISQFERRVQANPNDYLSLTILAELHTRRLRETGDLNENELALSALRRALVLDPTHSPARVQLVSVLIAQHKFREALDVSLRLRSDEPTNLSALAVLGDAQSELGRYREADAAYRELKRRSSDPAALMRWANFAWLRGDSADALESMRRATDAKLALDSQRAEDVAWFQVRLGYFYFRTGDFDNAEKHYQAALKTWPNSYLASDYLAELRAAQQRYDEAIALYRKVVEAVPRPEFFQALGDVYTSMGKPNDARPWLDRARLAYHASVDTGALHYIHHLATFYSDSQLNGPEAVKWARQDIELRQTVWTHDALAWAQYRNAEFSSAVDTVQKALAFGTQDAHLLFHAGTIYSRAGKMADGKKLIRQALTTNPRHNSFHVHR